MLSLYIILYNIETSENDIEGTRFPLSKKNRFVSNTVAYSSSRINYVTVTLR